MKICLSHAIAGPLRRAKRLNFLFAQLTMTLFTSLAVLRSAS